MREHTLGQHTTMEARILKSNQVVDATGPLPSATAPTKHTKRARLVEAEDGAMAIECTCSCGEITLVELELPKS